MTHHFDVKLLCQWIWHSVNYFFLVMTSGSILVHVSERTRLNFSLLEIFRILAPKIIIQYNPLFNSTNEVIVSRIVVLLELSYFCVLISIYTILSIILRNTPTHHHPSTAMIYCCLYFIIMEFTFWFSPNVFFSFRSILLSNNSIAYFCYSGRYNG